MRVVVVPEPAARRLATLGVLRRAAPLADRASTRGCSARSRGPAGPGPPPREPPENFHFGNRPMDADRAGTRGIPWAGETERRWPDTGGRPVGPRRSGPVVRDETGRARGRAGRVAASRAGPGDGGGSRRAALVACGREPRRISRHHRHAASRIGVLASGSGTILEAILAADLPVAAGGRRPAVPRPRGGRRRLGVPAVLVDRSGLRRLRRRLRPGRLHRGGHRRAGGRRRRRRGHGRVRHRARARPIHAAFPGRILNTHPALLPAFPGWHAVADALAAGVAETGTTVHVATLEMDAGPVLAQAAGAGAARRHRGDPARAHQGRSSARSTPPPSASFIDGLAATAGDGTGSPPEVAP